MFGMVRIKIGERAGSVLTASPEYEDCKKATAYPSGHVYESAVARYRAGGSRRP